MTLPEKARHIHFIGIGGYGMSALAFILLKKGCRVSGSDIRESSITAALAAAGAAVSVGHRAGNIGKADLVIYSTAINAGNPEMDETARLGIPLWHRSELLAALLNSAYGIAIAGAHGKTTTTAMIALLLEAAGLDPTAIVGGVVPAFGSNARLGSGPYLVAEADESDSSFTRYYPRVALVTGIEPDHLEHYGNDYTRLQQAYADFLSHVPGEDGIAILNADDPALCQLGAEPNCRVIYYIVSDFAAATYTGRSGFYHPGKLSSFKDQSLIGPEEAGINYSPNNMPPCCPSAAPSAAPPAAEYSAVNIGLEPHASRFDLIRRGSIIVPDITLGVPGLHNVSNAVGALALADQLVPDLAACVPALKDFSGAGRRFELIGEANNITVIDDYAHHPTEIRVTLEAARLSGRRVLCLFQPHRYSRTAALFEEFASAFADSDQLFLHAIYSAGEAPLPGITSAALATRISELNTAPPVTQNDNITVLEETIAATARPGDLIITMGAGDITCSAPRILKLLKKK